MSRNTPAFLFWAFLLSVSTALAGPLSESARSRLRFRLENLASDVELTIRNHRSDELDFRNQRRIEEALKIRERIPFDARIGEIRAELRKSARESGVALSGFRLTGRDSDPAPVPREITIGEQRFRPRPAQIAESIDFLFVARADRARLAAWVRGWHDSMTRVMELVRIRGLENGHWEVRGRAFRFRRLRFPRLRLADPRSLLPDWARRDPRLFAREEPALWSIVEKTEKDAPRAAPLLTVKERFMLEDARIGFFFQRLGQRLGQELGKTLALSSSSG